MDMNTKRYRVKGISSIIVSKFHISIGTKSNTSIVIYVILTEQHSLTDTNDYILKASQFHNSIDADTKGCVYVYVYAYIYMLMDSSILIAL